MTSPTRTTRPSRRTTLPAAASAVVVAAGLAACSPGAESTAPQDAEEALAGQEVTLKVAIDEGLEKEAVEAFETRAEEFTEENPNITVEAQEYTWTGTTFAADLAGGTLPTVFTLPFTDGRGLIEREQIADVSGMVAALPYADRFNETVAVAGQAPDGAQWAVPISAYGQGIHYNRTLFEQAGLDPDNPPATWEEVRQAAKQISDETGQTGFAMMTSANTGGWILTSLVYAMGGRAEAVDGENATATIDTPEYAAALEYLHAMRWEDDSMGDEFLYDWATSHAALGSGKVGMLVSGGGDYQNLVTQNAMNPDDYGVTVLPMEGDDAAVLGGGTLAAVAAKATAAEQAAAVQWIDFYYMGKLTTSEGAVANAEAAVAQDQPVGAPVLPVFDKETYDQSQEWIADLVNVPLEQFAPYTDSIYDQPLAAEPPAATQDLYATLDPVVQAVLTDENADIDTLLADAEKQAQTLIDRS